MAKGIKRQLDRVQKNLDKEIRDCALLGGVAAGLASEGYNGGYRDALEDVKLALNGVEPNRRRWWKEENDSC